MRLKLVDRRERWGLTRQAWLMGLGLLLLLTVTIGQHLYPFFAVQQPIIAADTLVVEGWINDENLVDAAAEFRSRPSYQRLIITGGALSKGYYLSQYKTFAELGKATLVTMGMPATTIIAVPSPQVKRDRTYTSAISFRNWLDQNPGQVSSANLISTGAHARRSWKLFQKALGNRVSIGVIAAPERDFNVDRWWTSSEGFKRILFEMVGYFYIKLFGIVE
jgi:uncharacterized SAM-binding protein YcdF (DUF218 family)